MCAVNTAGTTLPVSGTDLDALIFFNGLISLSKMNDNDCASLKSPCACWLLTEHIRFDASKRPVLVANFIVSSN